MPVNISAVSYGGASIFNLTYNFHLTTGDNGNVFQIANGRDSNRTQNFVYDRLNRISQAYSSGANWGEAYTIDPWGNLTTRSGVSGKTLTEPLACPANTQNQLRSCYNYDAAGNLIQNGSATYLYDAETRGQETRGQTGRSLIF